jgi:hypothetical protein
MKAAFSGVNLLEAPGLKAHPSGTGTLHALLPLAIGQAFTILVSKITMQLALLAL